MALDTVTNLDDHIDKHNLKLALVEISPILIPYVLGFFVFRGLYVTFPIYLQLKEGYSETEIVNLWAIISTVALFAGGLTRIPAGILSDRIGRVKAISLGFLLYLLALSLLIFASGIWVYLVSITLVRMTLNLYAMTGRGIASASEREKGFKNGMLTSMVGLGSLLGPLVLSYSLDNFQPDTMLYIIVVFIGIDAVVFFIALKFIPILFKKISDTPMEFPLEKMSRKNVSARQYFKDRGVIKSISLFFATGIVYGLITVIFTIYGYNVLLIDITTIGLVVGIGALSNMLIAPIVGALYMRFLDEQIRLIAWFGIALASFITMFGQVSSLLFFTGYVLLSVSNSMFFTMEITRLGRIVKKEAFSIIFGTATTLVIIGSAISSSVTKVLYEIDTEATFIAAFGISLITFLVLLLTTPLKRSQ